MSVAVIIVTTSEGESVGLASGDEPTAEVGRQLLCGGSLSFALLLPLVSEVVCFDASAISEQNREYPFLSREQDFRFRDITAQSPLVEVVVPEPRIKCTRTFGGTKVTGGAARHSFVTPNPCCPSKRCITCLADVRASWYGGS